MWNSLPLRLQNEWKMFYELDPDEGERNDWGLAHVVQVLVKNGKPLSDFRLPFGDLPTIRRVQSVTEQERIIDAWIIGSNAIFKEKAAK